MSRARSAWGQVWAQRQRETWALAKQDEDRDLLALRAEGLTYERMAVRLGISRAAVADRLAAARRRARVREGMTSS